MADFRVVSPLQTALNHPEAVSHPLLASCQRLTVDVEDVASADLLRRLPAATAFIAAALQPPAAGRVLVHCAQGVSRSAAVVAAHLMASEGLSVAAALERLRRVHPAASPSPALLQQLQLFSDMGCSLEEGHLPYKRHLLQLAAQQYHETGTIDTSALAQPVEPALHGAGGISAGGSTTTVAPQPVLYRCRKCRCLVATAHNVVETEDGPGAAGFSWRKRDKLQRSAAAGGPGGGGGGEEGSLFVEPMRWMEAIVGGPVHGKLYCPK